MSDILYELPTGQCNILQIHAVIPYKTSTPANLLNTLAELDENTTLIKLDEGAGGK